ncbi:MAG: ATP-grasp fold amidoligase family protein [Patescibacteria group bacterium]|nr:ATP-grasp fold amidoligase family protein [Patescibacteria group bacterium]
MAHIRARFRRELGREPDLANPQTFNEKLQWLKLYRRAPGLNRLVDKCVVRRVVEQEVGSRYLNELYGVFETPDALHAALGRLPDSFVIKPNHWSGAVWRVPAKRQLDWPKVSREMTALLAASFYDTQQGEWCYRGISPRLMAERFLNDDSGQLRDYKLFCFAGRVHYIQVHVSRFEHHAECFFDRDWNRQSWAMQRAAYEGPVPRPASLPEMIAVAERLSAGHPFLRVDLYDVFGRVIFGELTLFPNSGWNAKLPDSMDRWLGSLIPLEGPLP